MHDMKSRIDYYGGMVKTFQRGDIKEYGTTAKIIPMTNEVVVNEIDCFAVDGDKDNKIEPQSILPDISEFELVGDDLKNGQECQKWQKMEQIGQKVSKYTMWLKLVPSLTGKGDLAVPVHYEMRGYNSLLGSHFDHYYLSYDNFSPEVPDDSVFDLYEESRLDVYRQNLRFIHSKNRKGLTYTLASNHMADMTNSEMKILRGRIHDSNLKHNGGHPHTYDKKDVEDAPDALDWRLYGAVTPVKDQSVCGSCWSFGSVGTLEGTLFLNTGKLVRLSQQALVDCSWGFGNNGCDGGEDFRAYEWMMKHGGIPTEASYGPYLGQDSYCNLNKSTMGLKIKGWVNVTSGDVSGLKVAIAANGPVSVAIDAAHKSLSFYSNGVYYEEECNNDIDGLDHAVLAVGYR